MTTISVQLTPKGVMIPLIYLRDDNLELVVQDEYAIVRPKEPVAQFPVHQKREQMRLEEHAYEQMHTSLLQTHLGQHVAIVQGELVDHDHDPVALLHRIQSKYANQVVLQRKVTEASEPVILIRSPRFEVDL